MYDSCIKLILRSFDRLQNMYNCRLKSEQNAMGAEIVRGMLNCSNNNAVVAEMLIRD